LNAKNAMIRADPASQEIWIAAKLAKQAQIHTLMFTFSLLTITVIPIAKQMVAFSSATIILLSVLSVTQVARLAQLEPTPIVFHATWMFGSCMTQTHIAVHVIQATLSLLGFATHAMPHVRLAKQIKSVRHATQAFYFSQSIRVVISVILPKITLMAPTAWPKRSQTNAQVLFRQKAI
jgi:hypothetical protein